MTPIDIVVSILLVSAMIPLARFIYRYHRYSPFDIDPLGKTVMRQKVAMILVLTLALTFRIWGDWPGRTPLSLIIFGWLVYIFWQMEMELERIQEEEGLKYDRYKVYHRRFERWRAERVYRRALRRAHRKHRRK